MNYYLDSEFIPLGTVYEPEMKRQMELFTPGELTLTLPECHLPPEGSEYIILSDASLYVIKERNLQRKADGLYMTLTAKDAAALLDDTVIDAECHYVGTAENVAYSLMRRFFVSPFSSVSYASPVGYEGNVSVYPYGEKLGECVRSLLRQYSLSVKLTFDISDGSAEIEVFKGEDYTLSQQENDPLLFSNTISNASFIKTDGNKKGYNYVIIRGFDGSATLDLSGSGRKIMASVSAYAQKKGTLTAAEYTAVLLSLGREFLAKDKESIVFSDRIPISSSALIGARVSYSFAGSGSGSGRITGITLSNKEDRILTLEKE